MKKHTGVTDIILEILPNFCWVTNKDILLMLEQIPEYENVTEDTVNTLLVNMKRKNLVDYKEERYFIFHSRGVGYFKYKAKEN